MTPMSRDNVTSGHPIADAYPCSACDYNSRGRRRLQASELQQQATSNNGSVFYMAP